MENKKKKGSDLFSFGNFLLKGKKIEDPSFSKRGYHTRTIPRMSQPMTKEQEQKEADEKEIEEAKVAASLLHPMYSKEWYAELDKCPAMKRQQAAFWQKFGSSKGW